MSLQVVQSISELALSSSDKPGLAVDGHFRVALGEGSRQTPVSIQGVPPTSLAPLVTYLLSGSAGWTAMETA